MSHTSAMKLTVLPRGWTANGSTLELSVFVSPQVLAADTTSSGSVPISTTAFHDWPLQLAKLEFTLHIGVSGGTTHSTSVRPSNAARVDVWRDLLGGKDAELIPMQSGAPSPAALSDATDLKVFPAHRIAELLKSANVVTADRVFEINRVTPLESNGAVQQLVPVATQVRGGFALFSLADGVAPAALTDDERAVMAAVSFYERDQDNAPSEARAMSEAGKSADANVDFHQWVARFSYYPWLLRHLGLLIDFTVPPGATWPSADDVQVWMTSNGPRAPIVKTRCRLRPGERIFDARINNPAALPSGCLPLASPEYAVVSMDVDGGLMKARAFDRESARFAANEQSASPSLRTGGLSVVKRNRSKDLSEAATRSEQLHLAAQKGEVVLNGEHLVRGYRIDVRQNGAAWQSLCDRMCENPWGRPVPDSGWTGLSVTQQGSGRYFHESIFLWGGWSLVATRPGKPVGQQGAPVPPINLGKERRIIAMPVRDSLPTLRIGSTYRFRATALDLAGAPLRSGDANDAVTLTAVTTFRRFDPVGSPLVVPRYPLSRSPGHTVSQLVIRSGDDTETWDTAQRHVAPPPIDVTLAEWHGLFDGADGYPSPAAYERVVRAAKPPQPSADPDYHDASSSYHIDYLPDPLARGATLFNLPNHPGPFRVEFGRNGRSFRIRLDEGGTAPRWDQGSGELTVYLAPAEIARIEVASYISEQDLDLLELWDWFKSLSGCPGPSDTSNGLVWSLTPARQLTLIHAVQRPLMAPIPELRLEPRRPGATFSEFTGTVQLDRASTGHLEIAGEWDEMVDELDAPGPERRSLRASIFQTAIAEGTRGPLPVSPPTPANQDGAHHAFGDTRARTVRYTAIATTRFRDQFRFADETRPGDTQRFSTSTPCGGEGGEPDRRVTIVVPSTARPEAPLIRYVMPLYGWRDPRREERRLTRSTHVERELRGSALRVYFDRPWFSSGDGERLAVVLWPGSQAFFIGGGLELPNEIKPIVSQWGMDPIWASTPLTSALGRVNFAGQTHEADGRLLTLEELERSTPYPAQYAVEVALFEPIYLPERRMWFCDVELTGVQSYRPFVRLALARYQPNAISQRDSAGALIRDCNLSRVILSDFAQLANDRTASVTLLRRDGKLSVSLTGTTYTASAAGSGTGIVTASLELRDKSKPDGWDAPGNAVTLTSFPSSTGVTVWEGNVPITGIKIRRGQQRVVFREYETLPADSSTPHNRLVYADAIEF